MKGNFIDRHLLRGCDLEWPTLFQQSSIGDLANKFCFLFLIERWAATSADSIWNLNPNYSNYRRKDSPWCTTPALSRSHRQMRAIGRRGERPLSRPDLNVLWDCVDSEMLRPLACPKHTLRYPNSRCKEIGMNWGTNQKKSEVNEPGDRPTCGPFLNSPVPIQTKDGRSASECGYWLGLIHRPNLSNAKEENCCSSWWTWFQWSSHWWMRPRSSWPVDHLPRSKWENSQCPNWRK